MIELNIEPLLSYIVARQITGKKITTLTNSSTGEQFSYSYGDQIYDYTNQSYAKITREHLNITVYLYKTSQYYLIKPKSSGLFLAHRFGSDEYYEITVNHKWVLIRNQKEHTSQIFSFS